MAGGAREGADGVDAASCLFLDGGQGRSGGGYTPFGLRLNFEGDDPAEHAFAHFHEVHHKALNDDTAWGTAMHIAARHPIWRTVVFPEMLSACRALHESFATYCAVSLASARYPNAASVLAAYPPYRAYHRRLGRLLDVLPTAHRRELAATAIARWCMSGPVLEVMAEASSGVPDLRLLGAGDRPDGRLRRCQHAGVEDVLNAQRAADEAFEALAGQDIDELGFAADDAELDIVWRRWEDEFLALLLPTVGVDRPRPAPDGHLAAAQRVQQALAAHGYQVALPFHGPSDRSNRDVEAAERLLGSVTINARSAHRPGRWLVADRDMSVQEAIGEVAENTGAAPALVLHGRRPADLASSFGLPATDLSSADVTEPVWALRILREQVDGGEVVCHVPIGDLALAEEVLAAWGERGPRISIVTSSCFQSTGWQPLWEPVLARTARFVLVDSGPMALAGPGGFDGDGPQVSAQNVRLGHPFLKALIWRVDGRPHLWTAVADDVTVQLLAAQLDDLAGGRLSFQPGEGMVDDRTLAAAMSALVQTENVFRFDALSWHG